LGPILFVLYVNDLPDCVNSTAKLFADDKKLYEEIIDPDDCQEIQKDLNTLSAWSKIWLLRFNETKCIVLRIRKCVEFIYYLNGIPLLEEDNQRDLGVIISNDLHPIVIFLISLRKQTNVLVLLEDVLLILHLRKYLYYTNQSYVQF
jgi:hypothetical protein